MNSPARVSAHSSIRTSPSAVDAARAYLSRYETDRRSIFVGNLPLGITNEQIKGIFEPFGKIEEIIIRDSASKFERKLISSILSSLLNTTTAHEILCFAFVQFEHVMAVSNILATEVCIRSLNRRLLANSF
jgi:RNA recognition motif-containing protein